MPDAAAAARRIDELTAELPGLTGAGRRVARMELATLRTARYVQPGGTDEDRMLAEEICRDVLADADATADQVQAASMMRLTLTMTTVTPANALLGMGAAAPAEMLTRTGAWVDQAGPEAMAAGLAEMVQRLGEIPDVDGLPPEIRSTMGALGALVEMMTDANRPDWDGTITPAALQTITTTVAGAPAGTPGMDLLSSLGTWLAPTTAGDRVAELEDALAGMSADHLLAPVLQRDLAQALLARAERDGGPDALREATELMERARAGMEPDHPLYEQTVRMLAGGLLTVAAHASTDEDFARAEEAAAEVLRRSHGGSPAEQGSDLFLRSMVGLLRSRRGEDGSTGDGSAAVRDLLDAIELLPTDHILHPVAVGQLGAVLSDRHLMAGLLENADAATYLLDRAIGLVPDADADGSGAFLMCVAAVSRVNHAVAVDDALALERAAERLRAGLARLPAGHMMRPNFAFVLSIAGMKGAASTGDQDRLRSELDVVRGAAAGDLIGVAPAFVAGLVGTVDVLDGLLRDDHGAIVASIRRMEAELAEPVVFVEQRIGRLALLGKSYLAATDYGIHPTTAAERAVTRLTEARDLLTRHRSAMRRAEILKDLAHAHRARGDDAESRATAVLSLQAHAGDVLLQSHVGHAVLTARGASSDAAVLARWCLADGDPEGAVAALELGRGLTLHAATSALRVPAVLRRVGRPDLAQAWQREIEARRDDPVPWGGAGAAEPAGEPVVDYSRAAADLRHQVIEVLRGTPEGGRLFTAPMCADVGRALVELGTDVLAYLMPGHILMISSDGAARVVDAPQLLVDDDGPLMAYLRASSEGSRAVRAHRELGGAGVGRGWRAALDDVCDWAGAAVLEPLLAELRGVPAAGAGAAWSVVLVAGGVLGAVPWPAARLAHGSSGVRYACEDVVLSSAASARQFLDAASRVALPLDLEPVLVCDPTGSLPAATDEVLALQQAFYPGAVVLGALDAVEASFSDGIDPPPTSGAGTPQEVLDLLPGVRSLGASLVHFSCHAHTAAAAEASYVELTTPLMIQAVLDHAAGRDVDAPGPLVVLAACVSDLTERDYDEALTLTTAFLAAGAVSVVGSRWKVDDQLTAVLMFAFHHFLVEHRQGAAYALRSAQVWMLDPDRVPLPRLTESMLGDIAASDPTDVAAWAAFGHHGR